MKIKYLFIITGVVFFISGLIGLFLPPSQLAIYGIEVSSGALYMTQWEGLASLVIGILAFLFRNVNDLIAQKVMSFSMIIYLLGGLIISIMGTLNKQNNELGWVAAAFCLLLMIGYISFLFGKNKKAK
ncbi:MAG TPA: hypothetical protein VFF33_05660 [Ignavibacteriaceae bacterium]|nr:hypothetical protein [Ignavibacteriaceae bacterium]